MGQYIYIELNIFAATVTVVLLFVLGKKKESFPAGELFAAVLSAVLAILVCDIVYWLVDGKTFFGARKINCAVNFLYFLLQNIACSLFGLFCFKATGRKITAGFSAMYFILAAFSVALSVASLVSNGLLYTVTPDNVYMWGTGIWYPLYLACAMGFLAFGTGVYVVEAVTARKRGDAAARRDARYMIVVTIIPFIGTAIQITFFKLTTIWICGVLTLLLIYSKIQAQLACRMERELTDKRIAVMRSQIQPHFIFNILTTIS